MGSVGLNSPRLGAFQNAIFPRGLDLGRCVILQDIGVFRADPAASFEAGMLVGQDASGNIIKCVGKSVLGVAKWNKTAFYTAATIDEPLSWPTATPTATLLLKHALVTNFQLRSATGLGGVKYVDPTDYTSTNLYANGAITRVNPGATPIPLATTVYATYTYQLASADLDFQGRNFWNFTDDVTIQDGKITVITDASVLFTSMYDTSREDYALTGAGKNLYCAGGVTAAKAGLFTTDSAEGEFVGHVIQVPTADDPFLGVRLGGDPVKYA
jgi:hypothetical protein